MVVMKDPVSALESGGARAVLMASMWALWLVSA